MQRNITEETGEETKYINKPKCSSLVVNVIRASTKHIYHIVLRQVMLIFQGRLLPKALYWPVLVENKRSFPTKTNRFNNEIKYIEMERMTSLAFSYAHH